MALIGNRSVLHKSPGRFLSGTVASGDRDNFDKAGMMRSTYENWSDLSAIPSGHNASAWLLPKKRGGMSSHNVAGVTLTALGAGAMGVNIDGVASMTFSADAVGQLIASATGSASFSFDATGNLIATLGAQGSASFTIASAGTPGALAWAQGQATMQVTAALVSYARGFMQGSTANGGGLTPESIASGVWAAQAASNSTPGTMGAKVNDGGGGGGGSGPTPAQVADAVWQHIFANQLLTVAKYLGWK